MISNLYHLEITSNTMFSDPRISFHRSSRILLLAIVSSLILHISLVFLVPTQQWVHQSGSASSHMNVSMRWSEAKSLSEEISQTKKEKISHEAQVQKTQVNDTPKPMETAETPAVKPQNVIKSTMTETKPVIVVKSPVAKKEHVVPIKKHHVSKTIQISDQAIKQSETKPNPLSEMSEMSEMSEATQVSETKKVNSPLQEVSNTQTSEVSQPVRYKLGSIDNPKPHYPNIARQRGWQGEVILGVYVKPDGSIKHLTFVKSTNYGVLNHEAYETVRTSWQFKEIESDDELHEPMYIEVPITFHIANR